MAYKFSVIIPMILLMGHSLQWSPIKANGMEIESDSVEFLACQTNGLILPGKLKTYNENTLETGILNIEEIKRILILEKSEKKYPQTEGDDNCTWSNYVKIEYMNDALIIFGNKVLEITSKYDELELETDTITLLIAEDFTMKASDADGLTGCNDFSYLIVNSGNNDFSLIYPNELKEKKPSDIATLVHDEGMSETIESTNISEDTLRLRIKINYHDGGGSYNLNIFRNNIWQYSKTDMLREN